MINLDIKSLYESELKELLVKMGEKPFKGKQIYEWLHKKTVGSYEEMTNLSLKLREQLKKEQQAQHYK